MKFTNTLVWRTWYRCAATCMTLLIENSVLSSFYLCVRHPQKQKQHLALYAARARVRTPTHFLSFHCRACINWMHNLLFSFNLIWWKFIMLFLHFSRFKFEIIKVKLLDGFEIALFFRCCCCYFNDDYDAGKKQNETKNEWKKSKNRTCPTAHHGLIIPN